MRAEIIASGTELLLGEVTDANTPFIANQLATLGIDLYYASIVGDNYERFLGVLQQARQRSDIIIITGGLGPTKGDISREVIAGLMGEKMEVDPDLKEHITSYFARINLEMPENNLKQATLIPSAAAIPNPLGTAPGWWVEKEGKIIISLPGPPGEMQPMWQKEVLPRLERKGGAVILSRTLKTWGLSEARIDQLVGHFMSLANPTLALYAKFDGIQLRITAKAANSESASELIREREDELRQILGDSIWGVDRDTLEEAVSRLFIDKNLTLAVAESFTGGFLCYSLANAPQSAKFFKGGLIAEDDGVRAAWGIAKEADGKGGLQSASRMAAVAREKFAADIGIGIDGYIEAEGGAPTGKAFVAISLKESDQNLAQTYPWRSNLLVRRSVMHALFSLRKALLESKV
jgi:nicotinamide-nucleotide amidase